MLLGLSAKALHTYSVIHQYNNQTRGRDPCHAIYDHSHFSKEYIKFSSLTPNTSGEVRVLHIFLSISTNKHVVVRNHS